MRLCSSVVLLACTAGPQWAGCAPTLDARAESFLKLIDRPRVALDATASQFEPVGELQKQKFSYATEKGDRVPGVLLKAQASAGRLPVVVMLHGTGGNKDSQPELLKHLASRGFLAVAIDGRYHGERIRPGSGAVASGSAAYVNAILNTYRTGKEHPFLYDTVWDVMRLIDYLESREDVDAARIGVIGFSKGGMEAYLAAAVDPRLRVAVPCIGVQSFRWALDNNSWQSRVGTFQAAVDSAAADEHASVDAKFIRKFYDRVAPGIYGDFDGPSIVPLIAPRPLLVINGDSDARTPRPGLMECVENIRKAYRRAKAEEKFEFVLQPNTGHKVNPDSLAVAVRFFERWLGTEGASSSN